MDTTSGGSSLWKSMKTGLYTWKRNVDSRNQYLFHRLDDFYDWQRSFRALQRWVWRPDPECNIALELLRNIRSAEAVGVSRALLHWWLNFWKSSVVFAYIRRRNGLRRDVLVRFNLHHWILQAARTEIIVQKCLCSCIFKGREEEVSGETITRFK